MENRGVILGRRDSDYAAGTLPYEVRNPSGDWRPFAVRGEVQYSKTIDWANWMDCVTRSALNSIEIQEKQQTGIEVNYCDREVALYSGTTREGNYAYKVADYIRHTGLARQSTYPDSDGTWATQYSPIPDEVRDRLNAEKKAWKAKWDVKDEDVSFDLPSLRYHLKHAPLQVVVPGHAICAINCEEDIVNVMDSYEPYLKSVGGKGPADLRGPIVFAKKIVLYKKADAIPDEHLLVDIKYLDGGRQVDKLKDALNRMGWMPDMEAYGGYDTRLAQLVLNFTKANLDHSDWMYWWDVVSPFGKYHRGHLVDAPLRKIINDTIDNIKK